MRIERIAAVTASLLLFAGSPAYARAPAAQAAEQEMTEARFWAIVATSASGQDLDKQTVSLRNALDALTPAELEGYQRVYDRLMRRSYSWDLWGAAFVANGGASDDGFDYFCRWLISRGEATFAKVSANPDSLADVLGGAPGGELEFEAFGYIAPELWARKTGRRPAEMPMAEGKESPEPSGTPFSEDPAALKARYPKLAARFGVE